MKKLIVHIENLLQKHDCVIIPGFGGFIANYEQARVNTDKNMFLPPARKIGFNIHLTYNDGLLAQELMKQQTCSFSTATQIIKDEVTSTVNSLTNGQSVKVGKVGMLSRHNEITVFEPDELFVTDPHYYGLFPCRDFSKLTTEIPFSKYIKGTAAAIIATLLLLPVNVFDKPVAEEASLFSLQNEYCHFKADTIARKETTIAIDSLLADTLVFNQSLQDTLAVVTETKTPEPEQLKDEVIAVKPVKSTNKSGKTPLLRKSDDKFYVIIASLPTEKVARQYLREIRNYTFNDLCILKGKRRYLISVKEFENKAEADLYVDEFREEKPKFSKAWIATGENS